MHAPVHACTESLEPSMQRSGEASITYYWGPLSGAPLGGRDTNDGYLSLTCMRTIAWHVAHGVNDLSLQCRDLENIPVAFRGPLYGIPFGVKDNIDVAGLPTTAACEAFRYTPSESAPTVQTLMDAGELPIGIMLEIHEDHDSVIPVSVHLQHHALRSMCAWPMTTAVSDAFF